MCNSLKVVSCPVQPLLHSWSPPAASTVKFCLCCSLQIRPIYYVHCCGSPSSRRCCSSLQAGEVIHPQRGWHDLLAVYMLQINWNTGLRRKMCMLGKLLSVHFKRKAEPLLSLGTNIQAGKLKLWNQVNTNYSTALDNHSAGPSRNGTSAKAPFIMHGPNSQAEPSVTLYPPLVPIKKGELIFQRPIKA